MTGKPIAKTLMVLNGIFLLLNMLFLQYGESPTVNFIAAMICLMGLMSGYMLYSNGKDD